MPKLASSIRIKLFLILRVLPVLETVALYLFLIGGMAFVLLSVCAVIFISTVKIPTQPTSPITKKAVVKTPSTKTSKSEYLTHVGRDHDANKEMDVYYCSLLGPNSSDNEEA